jgi:hypothetical protein
MSKSSQCEFHVGNNPFIGPFMNNLVRLWPLFLLSALSQHVPTRSYTHCAIINAANNIVLRWTLLNNTHIALFLQAKVSGYVSLGFSEDGTMGNMNGPKGFTDAWIVRCLVANV